MNVNRKTPRSSKRSKSAKTSKTTSNDIPRNTYKTTTETSPIPSHSDSRSKRFSALLDAPNVDLEKLRELSWSGVPSEFRAQTWKILLGYLPTNKERRERTLERKRQEYTSFLPEYERVRSNPPDLDEYEATLFHQISIDVPRTNPMCPIFQESMIQRSLEKILYLWAIRHPASGYVQGINDLATPFFIVFLSEFVEVDDSDNHKTEHITQEILERVEADCFWCMTKLLDGIQENYTFAQPGIQRMIFKLEGLTHRIDAPLAQHLEKQETHFIQFAFRWMNCLLMRELPLRLIVRIWDTYLAEAEEFSVFHVYVCASLLVSWSDQLKALEFHDLMTFLQNLPTKGWETEDVDLLLSQAFLYKTLFQNCPSHLNQ